MSPTAPLPPLPRGSEDVAAWAATNGLAYVPRPDEAWFRQWEPYDTIAPPSFYFNSCSEPIRALPGAAGRRDQPPPGQAHITLVEPWYASEDGEPLERTVLAFATHPGLTRRAAARAGEHFLTRVAFLESPPPPTVLVGDKLWDTHVTTLAASPSEADAAFHRRLRKLLAGWGFQGHIELRPGGAAIFYAGTQPTPSGYDRMRKIALEIVGAAVSPR